VRTLEDPTYKSSGLRALQLAGEFALVDFVELLRFVALFSLVTAVAFRGGLMRAMGLELVTGKGRPASRARVLARTVIAWAPIIAIVLIERTTLSLTGLAESAPALLVLLAGAIVAGLHPQRGIQDRLAGTWIVPR
jgi:hypothetical protein